MTPFAAVIFDMDGLLLDSEILALQAFQSTCSDFDIPCQRGVFNRLIGTSRESGMQILKSYLAKLVDAEKFAQLWDIKYHEFTTAQPIPLKPGVRSLLSKLDQLGTPTAVATSTDTQQATHKLVSAEIVRYFDCIVGGDMVTNSKPNPDIYLNAAAKLNQRASACLALEDSENGVRAALAAGMTVVQIPDLIEPGPEFVQLGHIVLNSLDDVLDFDFVGYLAERRQNGN